MGKNGKFGKDYGKVVGKDHPGRPGWKGPGFTKKAEPKQKKAKPEEEKEPAPKESPVPVKLQQILLNIFRDTFSGVIDSDDFRQLLQDVKGALYDRDFNRAFGKEEYLEVYSARWSPSRSLCYASILLDLQEHFGEMLPRDGNLQLEVDSKSETDFPSTNFSRSKTRIVSIGGGAAEIVAFGGFLKLQNTPPVTETTPESADEAMASLHLSDSKQEIELLLVDTASWANVVSKLQTSLTTPPPISKYASAAAKEANSALIRPEDFTAKFLKHDVLAMNRADLGDLFGQKPVLVTLFFTLNELYTASISKTTAFLLEITSLLPSGSLLLVVDSPGSYSETKVGTEEKKYPMKFLLDHTLIETQKSRGKESVPDWVKVHSEDSQWFRLSENLRFPIQLENMRYQVHLYRRS
ncbi:hypothetical protein MFRU_008g01440 [Monilinia fructicola]|uniref:25S rRNA (Uridine(2843)-N(3))-methyltransferase n=1 Tax=Monilinia fructicola TaxID=38448 RepID=A0A5M9J692_MONFR|nr:hypothetical protein EYC84_010776 [Monilinia fructicola]KAG4031785.1 hypothetical protein MFRU_008g01440 [Monilinia fructicola]